MSLTAPERETVITFSDEDDTARVHTHQRRITTKLLNNPAAPRRPRQRQPISKRRGEPPRLSPPLFVQSSSRVLPQPGGFKGRLPVREAKVPSHHPALDREQICVPQPHIHSVPPGLWMARCHIAEHHESGMRYSFEVTE